jgi:hypothetical protein
MEQCLPLKVLHSTTFYIEPRLAQAQGRFHQYFPHFSRCLASTATFNRMNSTTPVLFWRVIVVTGYGTMFVVESFVFEDLVH